MKYACLIYGDGNLVDPLPPSEMERLRSESLDYDAELRKSGHLVAAQALQSAHTATTVRVRNGKVSTTDGPFAETKEQLGGFIVVEARDLNEAIRLASKIPAARYDTVEVRPIQEVQ